MPIPDRAVYHADLSKIRKARRRLKSITIPTAAELDRLIVNPALELIPVSWCGLPGLFGKNTPGAPPPEAGAELVMVWRSPADSRIHTATALAADLLALKIVSEEIDPGDAAIAADAPVGRIDEALRRAVRGGIILSPPSRIRRPASFSPAPGMGEDCLSAPVFTLQWHVTQECELNCRHCYDRSQRRAVALSDGLRILDELREFCLSRFVRGQVSFSGGNPFLHPDFMALYRAAADRGLATAILGNPVPHERLAELVAIQLPAYVQVSLEGLEGQNDRMRGTGHFRRTLAFLETLRDLAIPSEVMLTLTRDNLAEVLPLGELLRNRTDAFTFNRLAPFGAGAGLQLPEKEAYAAFLADYTAAMAKNPVLALKDSLCNIVFHRQGLELFDGCAGYGCGAAFNFVALLPDGEVHACRKFPSLLGNLNHESLAAIYDSPVAARYRAGSAACLGCDLHAVCRGCPAVVAGLGGDPFAGRDPFCFKD